MARQGLTPQTVPDDAYDATTWNGNTEVPTKNAIRDKIESMGGGGDMLQSTYDPANVNQQLVGTTATQTMTNKTLTTPKIGQINDSSNNAILLLQQDPGAVNHLKLTNGSTGSGIILQANGTDTNINLDISSKGSGAVRANGAEVATLTSGSLPVNKGGTGRTTATTAYGIIASGTTATGAQQTVSPGTSGQILKSNGASALPTFQTGAKADVGLGNVDNTSDATKYAAIANGIYPIGTVYTNATNSANPSTYLLGASGQTWVAHAEGRTIVGKAASGTFVTAGATMGAETHTLTISEMPAHNHPMRFGASPGGDGSGYTFSGTAGTGTAPFNPTNIGGGAAHNNIQPSIVDYVWVRTA